MPNADLIREAMSHWGRKPLTAVLKAIQEIAAGGKEAAPWPVLRALERGCVIELDSDARQVHGRPPIAFPLPRQGPATALITGTFSRHELGKWKQQAEEAQCRLLQTTTGANVPRTVNIKALEADALEAWSAQSGVPLSPVDGEAAAFHLSKEIPRNLTQLPWEPHAEPNHRRDDFDKTTLRFHGETPDALRLTRYEGTQTHRLTYLLIDGDRRTEMEYREGIYTYLGQHGTRIIQYDPTSAQLMVPAAAPLPLMLDRALFLSSGKHPRMVTMNEQSLQRTAFQYPDVPPDVERAISKRLVQEQ